MPGTLLVACTVVFAFCQDLLISFSVQFSDGLADIIWWSSCDSVTRLAATLRVFSSRSSILMLKRSLLSQLKARDGLPLG